MSILRNIERRLEGVFERGFRRAFRSDLQPVELARKLAREMDQHKTVSVSRVYGPNEFSVYLSPEDREGFETYEGALVSELESYLASHARSAGLTLVARPVVHLETDEELRPGEFGIACNMAEQVPEPPKDAAPAAESAPAEASPAPHPAPAPVDTAANSALAGVSGTQVMPAKDVRQEMAGPHLWLEFGGERHMIADRLTSIGRSRSCDITLADANVSRRHAEIRYSEAGYEIVDLDSTNGMEVNGRATKRHVLSDGDELLLGATHVRVDVS